jgi:transcriptional regulator with XRE-family HTH domain
MVDRFSDKFTLILKILSMSRAGVAAALGVNKSVVARWASGATVPSSHNLAQLSALMARSAPGFTSLDWDRDLDGLAALFGVRVSGGVETSPPAPTPPHLAGLALPFLDLIKATTTLRAPAYEGLYRSTRPYAGHPGRFIHDHSLVRLGADGLMQFRMMTAGVTVEGWMLPIQNQLFLVGTEFTGGALAFGILHGVNGVVADVLHGITLTSTHDAGRSPVAAPVVYHRIGELSRDVAEDDARLEELAAGNPVAPEGSIPDDLRRVLARDVGPSQLAQGGDWVLRVPIDQSVSRGPAMDLT